MRLSPPLGLGPAPFLFPPQDGRADDALNQASARIVMGVKSWGVHRINSESPRIS
ncbi:hypothetical protein AEP_03674 [Curvibacter sp. AEP1-3]|nr:hypothetical protein AEP_03674 [Curvibacter sp. AEP1-3]